MFMIMSVQVMHELTKVQNTCRVGWSTSLSAKSGHIWDHLELRCKTLTPTRLRTRFAGNEDFLQLVPHGSMESTVEKLELTYSNISG